MSTRFDSLPGPVFIRCNNVFGLCRLTDRLTDRLTADLTLKASLTSSSWTSHCQRGWEAVGGGGVRGGGGGGGAKAHATQSTPF